MGYVQVRVIDGLEIVIGFNPPGIDPEATKERVKEMTPYLPEAKDAEAIKTRLEALVNRLRAFQTEMKNLDPRSFRTPAEFEKIQTSLRRSYDRTKAEAEKHRDALGLKVQDLYEEARQLAKDHVVRLRGPGYKEVTEEKVAKLKKAKEKLPPGCFLLFDGRVVIDWRGKTLFFRAGKEIVLAECTKLMESFPEGAKLFDNVSIEEREEFAEQERVKELRSLSPEEREASKAQELEDAAIQAVTRERAAYLAGQADPERIAKAWLKERHRKIRDKFDV